jgi:hypothetical protein
MGVAAAMEARTAARVLVRRALELNIGGGVDRSGLKYV